MKNHKISISFSKNYNDVYEFLIEKPNISQFICETIREKMLKGEDKSLEEQIERILDRLIVEKGISITNTLSNSLNATPLTPTDKLNNEDKYLIDSLF